MKVKLVFVPPGGGEADYSMEFDLPALPQPGDYISIMRSGRGFTEDFKVRRTWWNLEFPEAAAENVGHVQLLAVECEFAIGPLSSEDHKRSCEKYGASEFEATAY